MMWYWSGHMAWWGWFLGSIGMVVFWGLIIWGIWYAVTGITRQQNQRDSAGQARRILDERLARGEITPEEYQHLRSLIRDAGVSAHDGQDRVGAGDRR